MSRSKSKALAWLRRERVRTREATCRGGTCIELCTADLPAAVRAALATRAAGIIQQVSDPEAWRAFLQLPGHVRPEAERRLRAVIRYFELINSGSGRRRAASKVHEELSGSQATLFRWLARIDGVARADWLPALAPRYANTARRFEPHPEVQQLFLSLVARQGGSTMAEAYRETLKVARAEGWAMPSPATMRRLYARTVPPAVDAYKRGGERALNDLIPPQVRDEMVFDAYQALDIDGRRVDVFVDWDGQVRRPTVIVIQDIRTRKIVGHGVFPTESSDGARAVFLETFERYGLPELVWSDNGRFVAGKQISGGAPFRYRWRAAVDEAIGLLPRLGVRVHFTMPYSGRSKPIERAFRDLASDFDRHPAFAGAYCGNKPDAKPEEFTGRAVPKDEFLRVWAAKIVDHNQRPGRQTKACGGKLSFDQAFAASYGKDRAITKLTAAQRRYFFLAVKTVKAHRRTGAITFDRNRYWSPELLDHRGRQLRALYDPRHRHGPIIVETMDHRPVAEDVPCKGMVGFNDSINGREEQRAKRRIKRTVREQAAALELLTGARLRDRLATTPPAPPLTATVVRPFRPSRPANDAPATDTPAAARRQLTSDEKRAIRERISASLAMTAARGSRQ